MTSGIYEILNTVNGKRYIGSAVNLQRRGSQHRHLLNRDSHGNAHLQSAWNKHGGAVFIFRHVLTCSKSMLLFYEQQFLDKTTPDYNIARVAGSSLGIKRGPLSSEHRAKISAAQRGMKRPPPTPEARANIAAAQRGKKHPPRSKEARLRIGIGNLGKKRTVEQCLAQSIRQKGRVLGPPSAEHRAKLSAALVGRKLSVAHRAALSAARRVCNRSDGEL